MLAFPFSEPSSPVSCLPVLRSYTSSAGRGALAVWGCGGGFTVEEEWLGNMGCEARVWEPWDQKVALDIFMSPCQVIVLTQQIQNQVKCLLKYELGSLGNSMVEFMWELITTEFGQNHPYYVLITLLIVTDERLKSNWVCYLNAWFFSSFPSCFSKLILFWCLKRNY